MPRDLSFKVHLLGLGHVTVSYMVELKSVAEHGPALTSSKTAQVRALVCQSPKNPGELEATDENQKNEPKT